MGVLDQSNSRILAPSSPPPENTSTCRSRAVPAEDTLKLSVGIVVESISCGVEAPLRKPRTNFDAKSRFNVGFGRPIHRLSGQPMPGNGLLAAFYPFQGSQKQLKVHQGRLAIDYAAGLAKAAFGVKRPGACIGVPGVQTNGIARPGSGMGFSLFEDHPANTLALPLRMHGHADEVERFLHAGEVRHVDGPGLLGLQAQYGNDLRAVTRDEGARKLGTAQVAQHAPLGRRRRPGALSISMAQMVRGGGAE